MSSDSNEDGGTYKNEQSVKTYNAFIAALRTVASPDIITQAKELQEGLSKTEFQAIYQLMSLIFQAKIVQVISKTINIDLQTAFDNNPALLNMLDIKLLLDNLTIKLFFEILFIIFSKNWKQVNSNDVLIELEQIDVTILSLLRIFLFERENFAPMAAKTLTTHNDDIFHVIDLAMSNVLTSNPKERMNFTMLTFAFYNMLGGKGRPTRAKRHKGRRRPSTRKRTKKSKGL